MIAALSGEGLYRIPNFVTEGVGALSVNSASLIDTSFTLPGSHPAVGRAPAPTTANVTSPGGVALDQQGNIYVTDMTNGIPNLYQMNVTQGIRKLWRRPDPHGRRRAGSRSVQYRQRAFEL